MSQSNIPNDNQVDLIYAANNTVGESIVWDVNNHRLLWVDIVEKKIHAFVPENGSYRTWSTPDFVTSVGLRKDGGALVGLIKEVCLWDYSDNFNPLVAIETDLPNNRLNEGVVGPDGAFWVGTMQNNIAQDGSPIAITMNTGRLYRCTAGGRVTALTLDRFSITNTLVWTEAGDLITADTLKNELYRYCYDPLTQQLYNKRNILVGFDRGLPDGSTMDAEGYIWNCRVVGGGCVVRFDPEGRVDRVVDLPCSWPTSCTFGGPDLKTLYVTSARFTMTDNHLLAHPFEGGLFAIKPGVVGLRANLFG